MVFEPLQADLPRPVREWAEGLRQTASATGLSLRQLADRVHCSPSTLSRYLSGGRVVQDAWDTVDPMLAVLRENDREPPVDRAELRRRFEAATEVYQPGLQRGTLAEATDEADAADAEPAPAKRPVWVSALAAGAAAAIVVFAVLGSLTGWWSSLFGAADDQAPKAAKPAVPTAPLVTDNPPATVPGRVARTWSDEKKAFIGVFRFPNATTTKGKALGPNEGDVVQVVCHNRKGRLVHEEHPAPGRPKDSNGWYRIYSDNRLWYLPDHYVDLPRGRYVPDCTPPDAR